MPGPAAYGRGGTDATTTDANLALGRINPDYFAGGEIEADMVAVERALDGIADRLGVDRAEAARTLSLFAGVGRRLERKGEARGVEVFDDYAHNPTKVTAALEALREDGRRLVVLFQPHLFSRTRHLARELAVALAAADVVAVADVYAAREEPVDGVTGKLVVDALAEVRPGMPVAWTPTVEQGAAFVAATARPGDRVATIGAGDVDRGATLVLGALS
jgi:UDP-N-acetylmuramate--alanine ligase